MRQESASVVVDRQRLRYPFTYLQVPTNVALRVVRAGWPLDHAARAADLQARAALAAATLPLVVAVARRYQRRGLLLDDLVQPATTTRGQTCAPSAWTACATGVCATRPSHGSVGSC
jgi:hypothetical protein